MTHPLFVKRIARRYLEVYKTLGFVEAGKYADRVVGEEADLQEAVKKEVARLMTGGTPSGKNPKPI